jgi:hypothetical protein
MTETMAQVCEWRRRAEEIRTQAEDFSSVSAKESMLNLARTWDWLADDLEERLKQRAEAMGSRARGRRAA